MSRMGPLGHNRPSQGFRVWEKCGAGNGKREEATRFPSSSCSARTGDGDQGIKGNAVLCYLFFSIPSTGGICNCLTCPFIQSSLGGLAVRILAL